MNALKKFLLIVFSFIFRSSLFFGLTILATVLVFTDSDNIKKAIDDTGSYDKFASSVIESAKKSYSTDNSDSLPINEPDIQEGLKKALNSDSLKQSSSVVIGGIYDWLENKTEDIDFKLDFTNNKKIFAESSADYAVKRLTSLPACDTSPRNLSLFGIECYPGGIELASFRQQVVNLIMEDKTALKNNIITADDLPKIEGQKITTKYNKFPDYYSIFKIAPYVLIGLSLICALFIIFWSRTKRIGIKSVGSSLLGTAIILAITPLLYVYILPLLGFKMPSIGSGQEAGANLVNDITTNLYSQLNIMLINIAVQVAFVAVIFLIIAKFMKSNSSAYINLNKKSGLISSENKSSGKTQKNNYPIQTSEGSKNVRKKVTKFEKKYRKM